MMRIISAVFVFAVALLRFSAVAAGAHDDTLSGVSEPCVKVFIDGDCPFRDFVTDELRLVRFVRDRAFADVYIHMSSMASSGGNSYTVLLNGIGRFEGVRDTVVISLRSIDPEAVRRIAFLRILAAGLVRYIMRSSDIADLDIRLIRPQRQVEAAGAADDAWNKWAFRADFSTSFSGQRSSLTGSFYGGLSINRITEDAKFECDIHSQYSENTFEINSMTIRSPSRSHTFEARYVLGLGDHLSVGGSATASSSLYSNHLLLFNVGPAIEFSLFPYALAMHRQLRVFYRAGIGQARYRVETVYDRKEETLAEEALTIAAEARQSWGSLTASLQGSHYLHDLSKHRLQFFGLMSLYLADGLSLSLSGSAALIHDQLSLPKGDASTQDILLRRQELATSYSYASSFGLSYSFGSIYTNVVNPRFGP